MSHHHGDEIAELLAYKQEAGLSYRELAEETGINRHTLASWARKLRERDRAVDEPGLAEPERLEQQRRRTGQEEQRAENRRHRSNNEIMVTRRVGPRLAACEPAARKRVA